MQTQGSLISAASSQNGFYNISPLMALINNDPATRAINGQPGTVAPLANSASSLAALEAQVDNALGYYGASGMGSGYAPQTTSSLFSPELINQLFSMFINWLTSQAGNLFGLLPQQQTAAQTGAAAPTAAYNAMASRSPAPAPAASPAPARTPAPSSSRGSGEVVVQQSYPASYQNKLHKIDNLQSTANLTQDIARHRDLRAKGALQPVALNALANHDSGTDLVDIPGPDDPGGVPPQLQTMVAGGVDALGGELKGKVTAYNTTGGEVQYGAEVMGLKLDKGAELFTPYASRVVAEDPDGGDDYVAYVIDAGYEEDADGNRIPGTGRLTLKYTREDDVVAGYTVQLADVEIDPKLLEAYEDARKGDDDTPVDGKLPVLKAGEKIATASDKETLVAIRDGGVLMNPLDKGWWGKDGGPDNTQPEVAARGGGMAEAAADKAETRPQAASTADELKPSAQSSKKPDAVETAATQAPAAENTV